MSYSDLYFRQKINRGAYFVSLGVVILSIFTLMSLRFMKGKETRASQEKVQKLVIVNPSSQEGGVFWRTEKKEISWLIYGKDKKKLNKVKYDVRDVSSNQQKRLNHYVELNQLDSDSDYFFKLVTKKTVISADNNQPFSFHTLISKTTNTAEKPAYGKVISQAGEPSIGEAVILTTPKSFPLFTFTKGGGEWLIPLSGLVNKKTGDYLTLTATTPIKIEIIGENGLVSHIVTNPDNVSPLRETTILGKSYSLTETGENVLAATDVNKPNNLPENTGKIRIIYPKNNAIIPDSSPLIKGMALPLKEVTIEIKAASTYRAKVKADKNGIWLLMTPISLDYGRYRLLIQTDDQAGNLVTRQREFTIAKSGEQVLGEATKSAGTVSPSPTKISPTIIVSPSIVPTRRTAVSSPPPSVSPKVPVTGFNIGKFSLMSASLIVVGLGLFLVF